MTLYLLDSDGVIDHLKGIRSTTAFIQTVPAQGHILCNCDIVIAEIYAGLPPIARPAAEQFLASLQFLPTTQAVAQQTGIGSYDIARHGVALATTDTLIAAVAAEHRACIVTGNVKDYPMSGITVVPLPRVQRRQRPQTSPLPLTRSVTGLVLSSARRSITPPDGFAFSRYTAR